MFFLKLPSALCTHVLFFTFGLSNGKVQETRVLVPKSDLDRTLKVAQTSSDPVLLTYYVLKITPVPCETPILDKPSYLE